MGAPYYFKVSEAKASTTLAGSKGTLQNTDKEIILGPKTSGGIIDVVNDFIWSASPVGTETIKKIPKVYLTERKQELNSLISSALYYINAITNAGANLLGADGQNAITQLKNLTTGTGTGDASSGNSITQTFKDGIASFKSYVNSNAVSSEDKALLTASDYLKSYIGIYYTKKTGFNYVLPYFGENTIGTANSFNESYQGSQSIASLVNTGLKVVEEVASAVNIAQPGTFIEKPKHFQYPAEGKSVTVTFPLFNTFSRGVVSQGKDQVLPYQQNYELLWLLAYQNKPYRTSFSRILPPKIYTLTLPGQEFFPYCYISNMTVNFLGSRRLQTVKLPSVTSKGEGISCETTIPEAYVVTLTFQSLLADIGNTMISSGFRQKITTSTK
jgi:hypothetical protein